VQQNGVGGSIAVEYAARDNQVRRAFAFDLFVRFSERERLGLRNFKRSAPAATASDAASNRSLRRPEV